MQTVTVAIADVDGVRRARYEQLLQGEAGIKLLASDDRSACGKSRSGRCTHGSGFEEEVDRIKCLNPEVTLVKMDKDADEDQALFLTLRTECPDAQIVLLADDAIQESRIIQALEIGARGCLMFGAAERHLSKAVRAVGRGEAWVPPGMLGRILDRVLNKPESRNLAH
jgi:two-component system nitrate/nitrite response regulator NarL